MFTSFLYFPFIAWLFITVCCKISDSSSDHFTDQAFCLIVGQVDQSDEQVFQTRYTSRYSFRNFRRAPSVSNDISDSCRCQMIVCFHKPARMRWFQNWYFKLNLNFLYWHVFIQLLSYFFEGTIDSQVQWLKNVCHVSRDLLFFLCIILLIYR